MVNPSTSEILPLYGFTPSQFLVIAVEVVQELGWEIDYLSAAGLVAFADPLATSRRLKVIVKIERFTAKLSSISVDGDDQDSVACQQTVANFMLTLHRSNHAYPVAELEKQYEGLKPHFSPLDDGRLHQDAASFEEALGEVLFVFTPRKGYFVTPLLILINTAIFIVITLVALLSREDYASVITLGANSRATTLKGEVWRLLSNVFLHWDIVHLFMNMLALYFVGAALEPYLNKVKFTVVYLFIGVIASITSLWCHVQGISAGASGAIFGLYGTFLALLTTNFLEPGLRKNLLPGMLLFIGYGLLGETKENIDNAAHIGGLVSGLVLGFCLYPWLKKRRRLIAEQ